MIETIISILFLIFFKIIFQFIRRRVSKRILTVLQVFQTLFSMPQAASSW